MTRRLKSTDFTEAQIDQFIRDYISSEGSPTTLSGVWKVSRSGVRNRLRSIRVRRGDEALPSFERKIAKSSALPEEVLRDTLRAFAQNDYNQRATATALGLSRSAVQSRLQQAEARRIVLSLGQDDARNAVKRRLPAKGEILRYILTCAQSDTSLHNKTWASLQTLADHYSAEIMVSTFTYIHRREGSAKRGTEVGEKDTLWYDPRIEPYVLDQMVELAPTLVWNGHMNILPTAVDPLSGMDTYNGQKSSIFPHAKLAMKSVPAPVAGQFPKLQYTTGTATLRNYIQKKAGQKAEFDHVYGGLIVEVDSNGDWWVRQLITDGKGRIADLDVVAYPNGTVKPVLGVEAIVWGDIHEDSLEESMFEALWGENGMGRALRPAYQFMHDALDFGRKSHHIRKRPFERFRLLVQGKTSVEGETNQLAAFFVRSRIDKCQTVVVPSNHHEHLGRWSEETDWRDDLENAEFHLDLQRAHLASIRAGRDFDPLRWAVERAGHDTSFIRWLEEDESFTICEDRTEGGIAMHLHGDRGPNGARGSLRNLAKLGIKCCIGHSHTAGIFNGAWQTGVTAPLRMGYNNGSPSGWTHSHIVVHKNSKRQLCTMRGNRWRA